MRPIRTDREGGFTLIETLVAMTILAVGGVGIIALFAAGVRLQYEAMFHQKKRQATGPAEIAAQLRVDRPRVDPETKREVGPESVTEKEPAPGGDPDLLWTVTFTPVPDLPETYQAKLELYYRQREQPIKSWEKTIRTRSISPHEFERSVTYEEERLDRERER